jgi:hypothetical protein
MKILQGKDALNKANHLMEALIPSNVKHSFSNIESQHLAHDGKIYAIVKENADFVLKVANKPNPKNADDFDYLNGLGNKNKNVKRTYSESVRILNLMDVEFKRIYGSRLIEAFVADKGQIDEKTVLKIKNPNPSTSTASEIPMGKDEMSADAVPEAPADGSDEFDTNDASNGETLDSGENSSENPDDYSDVNPDDLETDNPEKMIQKLSGKLAYELRDFDDSDKYSNVAKFAMSMATSALQTDKMSDSDKKSIEKKLTAKFDGSGDSEDGQSEDIPSDNAEGGDELDFDSEPTEDVGQDMNKQESFKVSKGKLLEMFKNIKPTKKIVKENIFFEFADEFDFYNEPSDELTEEDLDLDVDDNFDDDFDSYNQYDVPQEKILFDIEEDIYSEPVRSPKNKQYQTSIGNVNVGRIDGDDDSPSVSEFQTKQTTKRNPFKYIK